jgi:ribose 5-phosphate isomerase A
MRREHQTHQVRKNTLADSSQTSGAFADFEQVSALPADGFNMSQDQAKRRAAEAALAYLPNSGIVGLGTGSTTKFFIEAIAALVRDGRDYRGVPTSTESRKLAESLGIPLLDDAGPWDIDVCVDGADEVSATLDLIKGGGGAHTREKIVNFAARTNVIIVDASKLSSLLGERWAVPVEVLPFGHLSTKNRLSAFGSVSLRLRGSEIWHTDSGNLIYDVNVGPIANPQALQTQLLQVPGVVDTGLFCGRSDIVIVAEHTGIRTLKRGA